MGTKKSMLALGVAVPFQTGAYLFTNPIYNHIISGFGVIRMPQVPEGSWVRLHALDEYLYTVFPFLATGFPVLINSSPLNALSNIDQPFM